MDYTQRLRYHYQPKSGWINDPNGLCRFRDEYHVFYQHAPHFEVPWKEPMYWGHAVTRDFLHWRELPPALAPDAPYDDGGCWSGTAAEKDGALYLFYASVHTPEGETQNRQNVSVARSRDGVRFEKHPGNPVIDRPPPEGSRDFRDPAVCRVGDRYCLVMASGNEEAREARLLLYESQDLLHWTYRGILYRWENARFAECPSLMPAGDGYLLAASVVTSAGHWFTLMYGTLEDGVFSPVLSSEVDRGPDQYAGQAFHAGDGRNLLITWIPGWPYAGYAERSVGCMSVPRELTVSDGKLLGAPAREIRHLLTGEDPALRRTPRGFTVERTGREPLVWEGDLRRLELLRDGYILEIFVNGGEEVYSVLL